MFFVTAVVGPLLREQLPGLGNALNSLSLRMAISVVAQRSHKQMMDQRKVRVVQDTG